MVRYLKTDSEQGYIDDANEVKYCQFNNLRHTILGCMVGDFDLHGIYVVSENIVEELVKMKKLAVDTVDNVDICRSQIKLNKYINFMVTIEGNVATLTLVEKINFEANTKMNSGLYYNLNEYILDSIEFEGEPNKEEIFKKWNIIKDDGSSLDIFDLDDEILAGFPGLLNRFKYLVRANTVLMSKEKELDENEAEYFVGMMDIVSAFPKLKTAIDAKLKETMNLRKGFILLDKLYFAKTMNEVLNQAIEENIGVLNQAELKSFNTDKKQVLIRYNVKQQDLLDLANIEMSVHDTQNAYSRGIGETHALENGLGENNSKIELVTSQDLKGLKEIAVQFIEAKKSKEIELMDRALGLSNNNPNSSEFMRKMVGIAGQAGFRVVDMVTPSGLERINAANQKVESSVSVVDKMLGQTAKSDAVSKNNSAKKTVSAGGAKPVAKGKEKSGEKAKAQQSKDKQTKDNKKLIDKLKEAGSLNPKTVAEYVVKSVNKRSSNRFVSQVGSNNNDLKKAQAEEQLLKDSTDRFLNAAEDENSHAIENKKDKIIILDDLTNT